MHKAASRPWPIHMPENNAALSSKPNLDAEESLARFHSAGKKIFIEQASELLIGTLVVA